MQYSDYIAQYEAQKEREAQLVSKYSDKPKHAPVRALRLMNSMERHTNHNVEYTLKALLAIGVMLIIVVAYCVCA